MLNNKNSNTNHNTNHDDDIVNNLIKIIYKNDKGQTLKNAILEKSKCNIYKEIEKMKNNKTKKINLNNVNSNSNSNSKSNNKSNSNSNSNINSNSNTGVCEINALLGGAFVLQSSSINSYSAPDFACFRSPML